MSRKVNSLPRVAIVCGLRTPFQKQMTGFDGLSALNLGQQVVNELLIQSNLATTEIEQLVFGQVILSPKAPNIAREIVLATQLANSTDAFSVSKACATSFQSTACVVDAIVTGRIATGIAGGADSTSVLPIGISEALAASLLHASKAKTLMQKIAAFRGLRFRHLAPQAPAIAEYSTGFSMGESAEQMAKTYKISRESQDEFALSSHQKVSQAWQNGQLKSQVFDVYNAKSKQFITTDNCFRSEIDPMKVVKLKPVFDKRHGTITSASSSPLTDGAAALLLMSELRAKELGQPVLAYIKAYAFSAKRVDEDLLAGPAIAIPKVLAMAGMNLAQMDLIDMHEAFSAQVLANLQLLGSDPYAQKQGYKKAVGDIDMDKFNVQGGSLAFGHPFAATGARMLTQSAIELKRRGGQFALVSACAAGGIGVAFIIEAA